VTVSPSPGGVTLDFQNQVFHQWAQFVGGHGGRVPPTFSDGWDIICHATPTFFSLDFVFGEVSKNKSDVCHVFCEELFMLDGRPHKAKLMLKQSLV